jgi:hypothetical protein
MAQAISIHRIKYPPIKLPIGLVSFGMIISVMTVRLSDTFFGERLLLDMSQLLKDEGKMT